MKQARKVALIDLKDYPRELYSAYWEIHVNGNEKDGFEWVLRIYDRATSKLLDESNGVELTRDDADTAAQTSVKAEMEKYLRPEPKEYKSIGPPANKQSGYALTLGPIEMLLGILDRLFSGLIYALAFSTVVRNERVQRIQVNIDLGAGAGFLRIYDGARPATGGAATTLLAELTFTDHCAGAAAAAALTMSAITADASANATGTATWFRCVDSTGTFVLDGSVSTSGSDLNLNSTSISVGQNVAVTSFVITDGNA